MPQLRRMPRKDDHPSNRERAKQSSPESIQNGLSDESAASTYEQCLQLSLPDQQATLVSADSATALEPSVHDQFAQSRILVIRSVK